MALSPKPTKPRPGPGATPQRRALYARIALVRKNRPELAEEETYRAKMAGLFEGRTSARDLNNGELARWATCLEQGLATLPTGARAFRPAGTPLARKIHAIWADLFKRGVIRNGSRPALRAFCARMCGKGEGVAVDPDLLSPGDQTKVVEALKAMQKRASI